MLNDAALLEQLVLVGGDELELAQDLGGFGVLLVSRVEGIAEFLFNITGPRVTHLPKL